RDMKPANLFLEGGRIESIKLLDFGIARTNAHADLTETGALIGTPAYMAPEQVGGRAIDPRVDVYALGAVMFACLTGGAPFRGAHPVAVLAKVMLDPPPPIRAACPDVPSDIEALVERMLSKDPSERPSDGAAALAELHALGDPQARSRSRVPA